MIKESLKTKLLKADPSQDFYLYIVGWCLIGTFALLMTVLKVSGLRLSEIIPPCIFHFLTGYYCPGCGGTRAIIALVHGQLLKSFMYHPFVAYIAVLGGWFMISQTIERISGYRIRIGLHYRNIYVWITLILIFGNWIIKNLVLFAAGIHLI
ncbi:MAG: DUF2752 domain-containing protein [Clostridiales bacterium]|nr:DUF2752 domain-containing protein [Clostridiales bacterium]